MAVVRTFIVDEELRLDLLAEALMGTERDGAVEALLDANPGLADDGPFARAGRVLVVPDRPLPKPLPVVNPWE